MNLPRERYVGLELLPDHDVATPTIVYAVSLQAFQQFVRACTIKHGVKNKRVKPLTDNSGRGALQGIPTSFAHIAFIGIDPREHGSSWGRGFEFSSPWWEVERLRMRCQFRKAFVYRDWSPDYIIPNVMEGEREW